MPLFLPWFWRSLCVSLRLCHSAGTFAFVRRLSASVLCLGSFSVSVSSCHLCVWGVSEFLNVSACSGIPEFGGGVGVYVCVCLSVSVYFSVSLGLYPGQWMSGCGVFLLRPLILGPPKPQALVYRGWARAAFSWYLGRGPAAARKSGPRGRAQPGAGPSDRSGIFCPLLVALRACTCCRARRREGPGSRSEPLSSAERTWKSSPITVPADPPGTPDSRCSVPSPSPVSH